MDKAAFYTTLRLSVGKLTTTQVMGLEDVIEATEGLPLAHRAYCFATAWHETNKTMLPVREAYWMSETWRKNNLRYYPYYGRGYVQLTWETNYERADKELNLGGTLIKNLDRAMEPMIAAQIMRKGMEEGWFTKYNLKGCLPSEGMATREQYMKARRIINGTDKADLVEDYAQIFEKALLASGFYS